MPQAASLTLPPAGRLAGGAELADPETIQNQKEQYARDLEEQLRRGVEVLGETHKQQTEELHMRANQERTRYNLAMDQKVKQQELLLSQEYNEQLMRLQQAAQAKRAELEQQATGLTLEFQQRKVQEEFLVQQLGIQQQHQEAQKRLAEEMQRLGIQPGVITAESPGGLAIPGLDVTPNMPPLSLARGDSSGMSSMTSFTAMEAGRLPMPTSCTVPTPGLTSYVPSTGVMQYAAPAPTASAPRLTHAPRSTSVLRCQSPGVPSYSKLATAGPPLTAPALPPRGSRPSTASTAGLRPACLSPVRSRWPASFAAPMPVRTRT